MENWIKELIKKYGEFMEGGELAVTDIDIPDLCREAYMKGKEDENKRITESLNLCFDIIEGKSDKN